MNDLYKRERNKTLIITEGHHEKHKLLKLLLLSFPEINISENNIVIYESNIYNLYSKIVKEYGDDWKDQDIDLPKNVSEWKHLDVELSKINFTNIILIFDYERHDPNFSEEIICDLQEYFSDINDTGQLFINYPMVESYLDIDIKDINKFENSQIRSNMQNGNENKSTVRNNEVFRIFSVISKFTDEIYDYVHDLSKARSTAEQILKLSPTSSLQVEIFNILSFTLDEHIANKLSHRYAAVIKRFTDGNGNYFESTRKILFEIIISNIKKAYKLQGGIFDIKLEQVKDVYFDELNLYEILLLQNLASQEILTGFIWILNTSVFIAANYTAFWNELDKYE